MPRSIKYRVVTTLERLNNRLTSVKVDGRWRSGRATLLPDDAIARSRCLPHQGDKALGRLMASAPLTVRIDLDPG